MKYIFGLFSCFLCMNSVVMGANGTSSVEFLTPISVSNRWDVDFGTIAVDLSAGPQIVSIDLWGVVTCPPTYVCSGEPIQGSIEINGAPSASFNISVAGQTAVLSDGAGHTLIFDPEINGSGDSASGTLLGTGAQYLRINGILSFSGNEPSGIYSSENSGGSGYQVTVNY